MKNFVYIFLLLFLFSFSHVSAFIDIENNWYRESILDLKNQEIINGFEDGTYEPRNSTSRAEILKILLNASGTELETEFSESCFRDVDIDIWYAKYICTASNLGFAKGYENGDFEPNGKVTVLEALTFASRIFNLPIGETAEGDIWATKYINFADQENIIPNKLYTSATLVSRGQAAEIISKVQKFSDESLVDYRSLGCSVNNLESGNYTIDVNGSEREYILYVPSSASSRNPLGLIVAFHGRTNSNAQIQDYMVLGGGEYGDTKNQKEYIVVYPAGIGDGPRSWSEAENVVFFDSLTRHIADNACVSRDKIYSVGHSLGGYMSNKIACLRGDVIAGMVGVASDGYDKKCSGPTSSLIMHLSADHLTSYVLGKRAYKIRSEKNLCEDTTTQIKLAGSTCEQKTECSTGNTVVFCNSYTTYQNDPHSWPKSGGDMIFDFLDLIEE